MATFKLWGRQGDPATWQLVISDRRGVVDLTGINPEIIITPAGAAEFTGAGQVLSQDLQRGEVRFTCLIPADCPVGKHPAHVRVGSQKWPLNTDKLVVQVKAA